MNDVTDKVRNEESNMSEMDVELAREIGLKRDAILEQVHKIIVGQAEVIDLVLIALLSKGHSLLVGVPGLAKTLLIRTLARVLQLDFNRIQFTPDLMPSDITGTDILDDTTEGRRSFRFIRGPIFTQILLADEINRTSPKTAGGPFAGHAGTARDGRWEGALSESAVFRSRDPEPRGAGRHIPAARSAVGQVHVRDRGVVSQPRGGEGDRRANDLEL